MRQRIPIFQMHRKPRKYSKLLINPVLEYRHLWSASALYLIFLSTLNISYLFQIHIRRGFIILINY